jgi:RNA polymerase sigma factor (sigma-70 family)
MDTDAELVARARDGNRDAFEHLVVRHEALLCAVCLRMVGGRGLAEDAVQEAVVQAMLNLQGLRQPDRFGPWLAGIGLNVCRRMLRTENTAASLDLSGGTSGIWTASRDDPERAAEESELAQTVQQAVMDLPLGQRTAILLFYLAGLTQSEIAHTLGIDIGAVKTRLFKGRRSLKRELMLVWKEYSMDVAQAVRVEIADVRVSGEDDARQGYMVLLRETGGNRGFPIWIGFPEGAAIAALLERIEAPRPMTYALAASAIRALGGRVTGVHISQLLDDVFYATLGLSGAQGEARLDARPSDALALGLAMGAPITVDVDVFERVAQEAPDDKWERRGAQEVLAALREEMERRRKR